jgi:TonB family protein
MSLARVLAFLVLSALSAIRVAVAADPLSTPLSFCKPVPAAMHSDWFPTPARRLGLYGIVTVSFGVDAQGRIDHPVVVASDSKYFTTSALGMLKNLTCEVPSQDSAGRRYTLDFQYSYAGVEKLPKSAAAEDVIYITMSTMIPGSHPTRGHGD